MALELFPKWLAADIVVYAFPLYHYTVNAQMKTFIERTLPASKPFLKPMGDRTGHPPRSKHPSIVVLSVAGFPEESVFSALSYWAKTIFKNSLLAELYRPGPNPVFSAIKEDVLDAFEQAGKEIATQKGVSVRNDAAP